VDSQGIDDWSAAVSMSRKNRPAYNAHTSFTCSLKQKSVYYTQGFMTYNRLIRT